MNYPNELDLAEKKHKQYEQRILTAKLFREAESWSEFVIQRAMRGIDTKLRIFDPWWVYYTTRNFRLLNQFFIKDLAFPAPFFIGACLGSAIGGIGGKFLFASVFSVVGAAIGAGCWFAFYGYVAWCKNYVEKWL